MAIIFDGVARLMVLDSNELNLTNLWSAWVDWLLSSDNSKYPIAFTQLGGNSINEEAGTAVPLYFFLLNGWRVRPREANHTLNVTNGVLLVEGGGDPFMNTLGSFVVRVNYQQPVQAITVATGGSAPLSYEQIAEAVWNKLVNTITLEGSVGVHLIDNIAKQQQDLETINEGVQKASLLVPHTTNL